MPNPLTHFLLRPLGLLRRRRLHRRIAGARALFHGDDVWYALDQLGIPGFGTDLVRLDFPPNIGPPFAQSRSSPRSPEIEQAIAATLPRARARLAAVLAHAPCRADWLDHADPTRPTLPQWDNLFLTPVDMVTLFGMIAELRPARYVEIGSGISTRVVHAARAAARLATEIISIDPAPRVEIEALCDRAVRARLEDQIDVVRSLLQPGDVLFFDGSHRAFPGSDVTRFFLDVLPRLPAGVVVHIHDIYLPDDYPERAWDRLWSEQYLLAAWLLGGGQGLEILLPCAELCRDPEACRLLTAVPALAGGTDALAASSFWLRRIAPG
jgi:Methyltransferase domain